MNHFLFQTANYIYHHIRARHTLGYNVHSPMLYDFTRNVIYEDIPFYIFSQIEQQRQSLLNNFDKIYVNDFGTGNSEERNIAHIAKTSLSTPQEGQLLFRIANYIHAKNILELGTSLGISTAYLATHDSKCHATTFEGSEQIANIAKQTWEKLDIKQQITTITGNINQELPLYLEKAKQKYYDIIYFDANHTYDATINYFMQCLPYHNENSIFIFDDIYYSPDMQKAWTEIRNNTKVTATIDLYHLGLVFFNHHLIKKNYYMR